MIKKYSDFIDEISNDELYEGLLAYGFISEKIPPVFTTIPFYEYCQTISCIGTRIKEGNKNGYKNTGMENRR